MKEEKVEQVRWGEGNKTLKRRVYIAVTSRVLSVGNPMQQVTTERGKEN